MTRLSHRIATLTPSTILTTVMVLEELRAQGKQVIELVGGEPDYDTPETGKEAGIAAIRANRTRYPPTDGLAELRKALALKLQQENGLTYTPKQILVASGTKPLITLLGVLSRDLPSGGSGTGPGDVSRRQRVSFAAGRSGSRDYAAHPRVAPELS
jgi:histidinol-phosphate/aromatic aminotransferase/cobyric acid decarboxylase-like protein